MVAMTDTIMFEMYSNTYIKAWGKLWCRAGCIPMGGSLPAQGTDLYSPGEVYKNRTRCYSLGTH